MYANRQFDVVYDDSLEPLVIASCEELCMAEVIMERLALGIPGKYFVWSSGEGKVLARLDTCSELAETPPQPAPHSQTLALVKQLKEIWRYYDKEHS